MQLNFFETTADNGRDKTAFSDPNFAGNKTKPVHRWVPWIAGFASEFVKNVIDENLDQVLNLLKRSLHVSYKIENGYIQTDGVFRKTKVIISPGPK